MVNVPAINTIATRGSRTNDVERSLLIGMIGYEYLRHFVEQRGLVVAE